MMQTVRRKQRRTPEQELVWVLKMICAIALIAVLLGAMHESVACEFHGGASYRHDSIPGVTHEWYLFDGAGLSTWLDNCDQPVFVQFGVHKQMNDTIYDYGELRVDFQIGWQWW